MPLADTGVNSLTNPSGRMPRRPNPVFSDEYGVVRDVLVSARREAGLSQRALAARLGKTGSHVAMIERGQRRVDLLEFCRIAECLGLSPDVLVGRISVQLGALRVVGSGQPDARRLALSWRDASTPEPAQDHCRIVTGVIRSASQPRGR